VPLDRGLACARELHGAFGAALSKWSQTGTELTLSVGLAIAHFMEPLEDLLRYGREAEKHAKSAHLKDSEGGRNGLAVHVHKRGGGPVAVRMNWSADAEKDPSRYLQQLVDWIAAQSVPGRVPYDLHRIAAVYESWPADSVKDAIRGDVLDVMRGKQPRGESKMDAIQNLIGVRVRDANSLRGLANELLVARAIGAASAPRE
jgi:CRISPR-associated protein Cmr2